MSGWVADAVGELDTEVGLSSWKMSDSLVGVSKRAKTLNSGFGAIIGNARSLGLLSEELVGPLEMMSGALQLTAGGYQAYKSVQLALVAYQAYQATAAAAETAAAAVNPLKWPALALAAAAAVSVYSTMHIQSGEWDLPGVDMTSPAQREQAALTVGGMSNG